MCCNSGLHACWCRRLGGGTPTGPSAAAGAGVGEWTVDVVSGGGCFRRLREDVGADLPAVDAGIFAVAVARRSFRRLREGVGVFAGWLLVERISAVRLREFLPVSGGREFSPVRSAGRRGFFADEQRQTWVPMCRCLACLVQRGVARVQKYLVVLSGELVAGF